MTFNLTKHHRHSIRLHGYDYSQSGAYFITLCVQGRECLFGEIVNGEMRLNDAGEFAKRCWIGISEHFPHVKLDEFVIMPNHVHGILIIHNFPAVGIDVAGATDPVALAHAPHCPNRATGSVAPIRDGDKNKLRKRPNGPSIGSLGAIIGQYKSVISKRINAMHQTPGKIRWQRDFYDRIGRNDNELFCIRQYISNNPMQWEKDTENPISKLPRYVAMPNPQRRYKENK